MPKLHSQLALSILLSIAAAGTCFGQGSGGSTASTSKPEVVASSSNPVLQLDTEPQQRRLFPTSDFVFGFVNTDVQTQGGNLSSLVRQL